MQCEVMRDFLTCETVHDMMWYWHTTWSMQCDAMMFTMMQCEVMCDFLTCDTLHCDEFFSAMQFDVAFLNGALWWVAWGKMCRHALMRLQATIWYRSLWCHALIWCTVIWCMWCCALIRCRGCYALIRSIWSCAFIRRIQCYALIRWIWCYALIRCMWCYALLMCIIW